MGRHLALLLALVALTAPAAARASAPLELTLQDDATFVGPPPSWPADPRQLDHGFAAARALRARVLKINLIWAHVAVRPGEWDWSRYDAAVDRARAHGLIPQVTLTAPAPPWATADGLRGVTDPDARQYGEFVDAAVRHYRGRVRRWAIWNEPNWPSWLRPQRRAAPMYRRLYQHAYRAVKRADPNALVLFGELAPMGPPEAAIAPLRFLRAVTCRDAQLRARRRCAPLRADGFAHHPYTLRWKPEYRGPGRDDVTIGSLDRLRRTLAVLARRRALSTPRGGALPIYLTEYGYHADSKRLSATDRAAYARRAYDIALKTPGVRQMLWYQVIGIVQDPQHRVWDTGLLEPDGRPRPSYEALVGWVRKADRRRLLRTPGTVNR